MNALKENNEVRQINKQTNKKSFSDWIWGSWKKAYFRKKKKLFIEIPLHKNNRNFFWNTEKWNHSREKIDI